MIFLEDKHLYLNDKEEQYVSVTSLIKKYEPSKDWDAIAEKYAKKVKKTKEEVQAMWKEAGKTATDKGTAFHNKMEAEYTKAGIWHVDGHDCVVCPSPIVDGVKKARPLKLEQGVYPELLVYSHQYKLAGQADLVEVVNGRINIKDYKTSKEIKKESHKHWKDGYEMMLYPLNNLMNSNFWHYSVQLNLYMAMLKSHNPGLKIGTMTVLHIVNHPEITHRDPQKCIKAWDEIISYKVPDLQKDVKRLLEHYKFNH